MFNVGNWVKFNSSVYIFVDQFAGCSRHRTINFHTRVIAHGEFSSVEFCNFGTGKKCVVFAECERENGEFSCDCLGFLII
jgi:hypothetical protein